MPTPNMDEVVLYILVRSDMASLDHGRATAQIAHAANQATRDITVRAKENHHGREDTHYLPKLVAWAGDRGWGTTLVLSVIDLDYLLDTVLKINTSHVGYAGLVEDPSYKINDGAAVHEVPVVTAGYALGIRRDLYPVLSNLPAYK